MSSLISKTIKYDPSKDKLITLACGCFWGTEHMFRKYLNDRIVDCKVGYANGAEPKRILPTVYLTREFVGVIPDFAEVLQVSYDPKIVTLKELTDFFFRIHDPTTSNSQGPDQGTQYRSGLFAHSDADLKELAQIKAEWQPKWGNKIATLIEPIKSFYDAEEYHQLYLDKNPQGYACPTHYLRDI